MGKRLSPHWGDNWRWNSGGDFRTKSLRHMIRFAEVFPDEQIVVSTDDDNWAGPISCRSFTLDDPLKRDFYAEMCRIEQWSTRTLEKKIGGMLFERTALSRKPEELIRQELEELRDEDKLTPDLVFRDPYFLDFLGLKDRYLGKGHRRRHHAGDGAIHSGTGRRVHVRGPAEAHPGGRRRPLPRSSFLSSRSAPAGGH